MNKLPPMNSQERLAYTDWTRRFMFAPLTFVVGCGVGVGLGAMLVQIPRIDWTLTKAILFVLLFVFLAGVFIGALRVAYLFFNSGIIATTKNIQIISLENGFKKFYINWDQVDRFDVVPLPLGIARPAMVLKDGTIFRLPLSGVALYPYRAGRYDAGREADMMTLLNQMLDQIKPPIKGPEPNQQNISAETYAKENLAQYTSNEGTVWLWVALLLLFAALVEIFPHSSVPKLLWVISLAAFLVYYFKKRRQAIYIRSEGKEKPTKANSIQLSKPTKLLIAITGFLLLASAIVAILGGGR